MIEIDSYVYVFKQDPDQAAKNKEKVLDLIEIDKKKHNIELNSSGYWYDYPDIGLQPHQRIPGYQDAANDVILPFVKTLAAEFGCDLVRIPPLWFQQYPKGSKFGWHTHTQSNFSCVYFVELPDERYSTEFLTLGRFPMEEGDVLFFPSFLPHRSPYIETDKRKTIISSNYDFNFLR